MCQTNPKSVEVGWVVHGHSNSGLHQLVEGVRTEMVKKQLLIIKTKKIIIKTFKIESTNLDENG